MPEISRFYGIVIRMYFGDHLPPHFHAYYGSHSVIVSIKNLSIVDGKFPPRALGLVIEWATLHQSELLAFWEKAVKGKSIGKIKPLK